MQRPPVPTRVPPPAQPGLPRHVAIIMDGNGRWARRRHLPRAAGHRAGVQAIRPVMEAFDALGVRIVTVYAFSTENWTRPRAEVRALMALFAETLEREVDELDRRGIQLRILGRREELAPNLQRLVAGAEGRTAGNTHAILNVAINYGGRSEIVSAVRELALSGADMTQVTDEQIGRTLYTAGLPDPDLIIRTAGEMRISNFLLWQAAYAELYVTDTLWPDFGESDVSAAIASFGARERKFGAVPGAPEIPVLPDVDVPARRTG